MFGIADMTPEWTSQYFLCSQYIFVSVMNLLFRQFYAHHCKIFRPLNLAYENDIMTRDISFQYSIHLMIIDIIISCEYFFHKTLFHIIHTFIYILTVYYQQQSSWAHHTFHK